MTAVASLTTLPKHTSFNSSDPGLTATTTRYCCWLLLMMLTTSRRGTSFSPPDNSGYRHPVEALRAIDDLFASTAAAAVLALARLSTKPSATTEPMNRRRTLRAPNERFARGKGARKRRVWLSTAAEGCTSPINRTREQDTKQVSINFRLPYDPLVLNAPRKSTKKVQNSIRLPR